jgi:hypothetical protein
MRIPRASFARRPVPTFSGRALSVLIASTLLPAGIGAPARAVEQALTAVSGVVSLAGTPVAGTEVGWYDPLTGDSGETRTDAVGAYSLSVASEHPFVLYAGVDRDRERKEQFDRWVALAPGSYAPVFRGASGSDYLYQTLLPYPAGTGGTGFDMALDLPGAVTVSAPLLAGKGVDLVTVDGRIVGSHRTDVNGEWTFHGLIPGRYRVLADGGKYLEYLSEPLVVTAGAVVEHDVPLERGARLTGRVRSEDGEPLSKVLVAAQLDGSQVASDFTNSEGKYRISGLDSGRYRVVVNEGALVYEPRNEWTTRYRHVRLVDGDVTKRDFALAEGGTILATVPGRAGYTNVTILDSEGAAMDSIGVRTTAAAPGELELHGIEPGRYTAVFVDGFRTRYATREFRIHGSEQVDLGPVELQNRTVTLHGRVHGAKKGVVRFRSETYLLQEDETGFRIRDGEYTLSGLVPGFEAVIAVYGTNREETHTRVTPTSSGAQDLRAGRKLGKIAGTITLAGAPVVIGRGDVKSPRLNGSLGTDSEGRIVHARAAAGTARISYSTTTPFVENSPFFTRIAPEDRTVRVRAGETTDVGEIALQIVR